MLANDHADGGFGGGGLANTVGSCSIMGGAGGGFSGGSGVKLSDVWPQGNGGM